MSKKDIFEQGQNFTYETVERMKHDVRLARVLMFAALILAFLALISFIYLLPLKETIFVPIKVDNDTGHMEVLSVLDEDTPLTQDKALTSAFFHTFLLAREGYHASAVQHNFDTVKLYTDKQALEDFMALWDEANKNSPYKVNGWNIRYDVVVKEILIQSDNTIYTRFSRIKRKDSEIVETKNYSATVRFKYTNAPIKVRDRYRNPLGFKVTHYDPTENYDIE